MQGFGLAIVGGIARALRIGPFHPARIELEETLLDRDADEMVQRDRIRAAVAAIDENLIGQEARGAAKAVKHQVARILDREWGDG